MTRRQECVVYGLLVAILNAVAENLIVSVACTVVSVALFFTYFAEVRREKRSAR